LHLPFSSSDLFFVVLSYSGSSAMSPLLLRCKLAGVTPTTTKGIHSRSLAIVMKPRFLRLGCDAQVLSLVGKTEEKHPQSGLVEEEEAWSEMPKNLTPVTTV
jgi:hypothetical protein